MCFPFFPFYLVLLNLLEAVVEHQPVSHKYRDAGQRFHKRTPRGNHAQPWQKSVSVQLGITRRLTEYAIGIRMPMATMDSNKALGRRM